MNIIQKLIVLLLVTSSVSAQNLKSGSVTETVNKRNEEVRLIKKMSLPKAYAAIADSLFDAGYPGHPGEQEFSIMKALPCIKDESIVNPLSQLRNPLITPEVMNAIRRSSLPIAYIRGQVKLEVKGEDILIRVTLDQMKCRGGILPKEYEDIYSTFWSNVSASLFIDGIKLSASEVN
jgi:hypothetical protein